MHLTWSTDTHLDSATSETRGVWMNDIMVANGDGLLITGDISDGRQVREDLIWLLEHYPHKIYFVLGNHDYYHRSFEAVNHEIAELCMQTPRLQWLDIAPVIWLTQDTCLIGHTGWGDARNGNFLETPIRLNDHRLIADLSNMPREELQTILQQRGTLAANHIEAQFNQALSNNPSTVIIATHVPPYPESAWHNGYAGAIDWIPDFTCQAIGNCLTAMATKHPAIDFEVFCGHGHSPGLFKPLPNLTVTTGGATYGAPSIAGTITIQTA